MRADVQYLYQCWFSRQAPRRFRHAAQVELLVRCVLWWETFVPQPVEHKILWLDQIRAGG